MELGIPLLCPTSLTSHPSYSASTPVCLPHATVGSALTGTPGSTGPAGHCPRAGWGSAAALGSLHFCLPSHSAGAPFKAAQCVLSMSAGCGVLWRLRARLQGYFKARRDGLTSKPEIKAFSTSLQWFFHTALHFHFPFSVTALHRTASPHIPPGREHQRRCRHDARWL